MRAGRRNQDIDALYKGTGGDDRAAAARGHASRRARRSTDPACKATSQPIEAARPRKALPARASPATRRPATRRSSRRTAAPTFAIAYPPPDPDQPFGDNPEAEKKARAGAAPGATVGGAPVHLTGFDALNNQSGDSDGPGVLIEALVGGFGALLVLAFVFGSLLAVRAAADGDPGDHDLVPAVYGLTTFTGDLADRAVPDRADRARRRDRLLAADRRALARGTRARADGDEAIVTRDGDRRPRRRLLAARRSAIGLLALVVLPLPFLRSVGYGGMLIPLVSVLVAHDAAAGRAALSSGQRLDWPHRRTDDNASRAWTRWAEGVVKRRRWLAAGVALRDARRARRSPRPNMQPGHVEPRHDRQVGRRQGRAGRAEGLRHRLRRAAALRDPRAAGEGPGRRQQAVGRDRRHPRRGRARRPGWRAAAPRSSRRSRSPTARRGEARDLVDDVRSAAHAAGPDVAGRRRDRPERRLHRRGLRQLPADDRC